MKGRLKISCPKEVDFVKMYGNLGNKHNQDVIRDLNPDIKGQPLIHCRDLKKNPGACNDMPLGDGKRGICPHNPYHPENAAKRRQMQEVYDTEYGDILDKETGDTLEANSEEVYAAMEMGLLTDLSQISPINFLLANRLRQKREYERLQLQAKLVIYEYAKALDSGKKK